MSRERENPLTSLREAVARFDETVAHWQRSCQGVDEVLENLGRRYGGKLERWRDETPSRELVWYERGAGYSVSMILGEEGDHPPLTVYSAVWQDDEGSLRRASVQLPEELVDTPVIVRDFRMRVNGLVESLHQQRSLLRQSPLPANVSISPLSPH